MTPPALGIGIITYSRLETLKRCLEATGKYTASPHQLMVADDGSADDTVAWARNAGYSVMTGANRGCAWNKNRALYYFLTQTACDPILLLEDDTFPCKRGWEVAWLEAAQLWQHVNHSMGGASNGVLPGQETPRAPMQCVGYGGQCTITTRAALERIGYLDSRFVGYGYEHVEWTQRFRWEYERGWNLLPGTVPCLASGVTVDWSHSWYDADDMRYNDRICRMIRAEPLYRVPWHSEEERRTLHSELQSIGAALV